MSAQIPEIFSSFDETPIASGSIAQVYRAVYNENGVPLEVVVKVRHPNVVDNMEIDLRILRAVGNLVRLLLLQRV